MNGVLRVKNIYKTLFIAEICFNFYRNLIMKINKISLVLLLSSLSFSVSLFSSNPHIVESPMCQKFMEDFNKNSFDSTAGMAWLDKQKKASNSAQEKYAVLNDALKLQKLDELIKCITFVEKFPGYQASVDQTKVIFDKINPKKVPNIPTIDKVNDFHKRKEVTQEEAWKLFDSEPCQNVYQYFLNDDGNLNEKRIKELRDTAYNLINHKRTATVHVSADPLNATKEIPLTSEKMLPENISEKAKILYACITLSEQKANSQNSINNVEFYLK